MAPEVEDETAEAEKDGSIPGIRGASWTTLGTQLERKLGLKPGQ
jgi:hypothetical protein